MRTRNISVSEDYVPTINLGRQGENEVSQVIFDVSELITDYGSGTAVVVVRRPTEITTYQHDDTVQSGDTVTWTVTNADTEIAGDGNVQLFWAVDDAVAKTITYQTYIEPALMNPTDAPVSPTGWISEEIGNLNNLNTTDKSNLVGAINEIADGSASGVTDELRQALLQIASKVAYIDEHGQDYYDDLYDALYAVTAIRINARSISLTTIGGTSQLTATTVPEGANVTWTSSNESVATVDGTGLVTSTGYGSATITATAGSKSATCSVLVTQATLVNISAVYTPSGTVYDSDSLDSLKDDLVVTALWDNGTTSEIPSSDYTLSGTLNIGTNTITVSYGDKETTFSVVAVGLVSISAVYTQSGTVYDTDSLDDLKADLVVTANYSDTSTQTITDYTLSGTLAEGTSTITVTYSGKSTTFSVVVTIVSVMFVDKSTSDIAGNVPAEYKMSYNVRDDRTFICCDAGDHPLTLTKQSIGTKVGYPIPLGNITSIKVTTKADYSLEIEKYDTDLWNCYFVSGWKSSGTIHDVSAYANGGYYYTFVIRAGGATAENTTIEVTRG